jgi:septum site-determining protein MinD
LTKFVAFVSGKGGVGKTTVTLNTGHSLAKQGKSVTLLDGNLVTPNLAIHLGMVDPQGTLNKFLRKELQLNEIIYAHDSGFNVIPASPDYSEFLKTNPQQVSKVFKGLENTADYILVDAPSGLGYDLSSLLKNCDEVVIVANPTLTSVMDALKSMQLAKAHNVTVAGVVLNMTNRGRHELNENEVYEILGHPIIANIRTQRKVRKSLHKKQPASMLYPRSRLSKEFTKIANHISHEEFLIKG